MAPSVGISLALNIPHHPQRHTLQLIAPVVTVTIILPLLYVLFYFGLPPLMLSAFVGVHLFYSSLSFVSPLS